MLPVTPHAKLMSKGSIQNPSTRGMDLPFPHEDLASTMRVTRSIASSPPSGGTSVQPLSSQEMKNLATHGMVLYSPFADQALHDTPCHYYCQHVMVIHATSLINNTPNNQNGKGGRRSRGKEGDFIWTLFSAHQVLVVVVGGRQPSPVET